MVELPAKCLNPKCGFVDPAPGIAMFKGDTNWNHFGGMKFPNACKRCGGTVQLLEGTYSTWQDQLYLERGPQWTKDALRELEAALEYAKKNFYANPDESIRRIEAASPGLGRAVLKAMSGRYALGAYGLIGAICAIVMTINSLMDDSEVDAQPQEAPTVITNVFQIQQDRGGTMSEEEIREVTREELQRLQSGDDHSG